MRTCPRCGNEYPADREHFYAAPGDGRLEYCVVGTGGGCHGEYWRTRSRVRRGRKFGVELEFVGIDHPAAVRALSGAGLTIASNPRDPNRNSMWRVVSDGSLGGDGFEAVSPPLRGKRGRREVRKAARALTAAGARIDARCGLHVHLDVSDLGLESFKRLFSLWRENQPTIDSLTSPSRRNGYWTRHLDEDYIRRVNALRNLTPRAVNAGLVYEVPRYKTLNVWPYPRQGTVEVRQHQGSLDPQKITAWIFFCEAMVGLAASREPVRRHEDLLGLLGRRGVPEPQVDYLRRRVVELGPQPEPVVVATTTSSTASGGSGTATDEAVCDCELCRDRRSMGLPAIRDIPLGSVGPQYAWREAHS